jgi:hypothetical protein
MDTKEQWGAALPIFCHYHTPRQDLNCKPGDHLISFGVPIIISLCQSPQVHISTTLKSQPAAHNLEISTI